ncbi:Uncharacterised protein g10492 [Pycnogonum litorale]
MSSCSRIVALGFLFLLQHGDCGMFRFGACPEVPTMTDFKMEKLYGTWYELQSFQMAGSCVRVTFKPNEDHVGNEDRAYKLEASAVLNIFQMFGITKPTLRYGNLTVPDPANPAKMTLTFPAASKDYWMVATDYKYYALTWSCKEMLFGHFESASIISRKKNLDHKTLGKLRRLLAKYHVNEQYFHFVRQKECPDEEAISRTGILFPL